MVVAFRSAVDAVDLATGLVRDTASRELGIRAGVSVGPVEIDGPVVNFASRLEGMTRGPKGIASDDS